MNKFKVLAKIIRSIYSHEYNKKHPLKALKRSTKWYLKGLIGSKYFNEKFWDYEIKFWLDSNQSLWLYRNYIMDWNEFNFIKRFIKPDDIIFDVGSNIGVYSLWCSKFIGLNGKINAFEPNNTNINRLEELIALNKINTIQVNPFAVSDIDGKLYFTRNKDNENQIISSESKEVKDELDSVTLDKFCELNNIKKINFLKLDIEGAEYLALKGAEDLLRKTNIDVIQFEINNQIKNFGVSPLEVTKFLQQFNYNLYAFNVEENCIIKLDIEKINFNNHSNYFALNNYDEVKRRLNEN